MRISAAARSELNRFNGDPDNRPNPCMRKIGPGPYFAVAVWPSDLASSAGLRTDINGRVLTSERLPIPGLYAVGADAASIFRGTYPGPGDHDRAGHGVCMARGDGYRRPSGHDADAAYLIGGRGSTASPASIL